jgi:5-methylcytosine-specific restriction endonuclease McrA
MCRHLKNARDQSLCNRCRFVKNARRRNKTQARRTAAEKVGDRITWRELGERDGWVCHICSGKVKRVSGRAKEPRGATVDHLIPVAAHGTHRWDNVALAHRSCNVSRGAAGEVQLRLVG